MRTKVLTKRRPFKSIQKAREDEATRILYAEDADLSIKEILMRNMLKTMGFEGKNLIRYFQQLRKLDVKFLELIWSNMTKGSLL